jgi:hypothetical protein
VITRPEQPWEDLLLTPAAADWGRCSCSRCGLPLLLLLLLAAGQQALAGRVAAAPCQAWLLCALLAA